MAEPAVGRTDQDRAIDVLGAGPGRRRHGAVVGQGLRAVAQVVAQQQRAHRVGDDVETQRFRLDVETFQRADADLLALGEHEVVEAAGVLGDVETPVVVELEAGEVVVAVVDDAGAAEGSSR